MSRRNLWASVVILSAALLAKNSSAQGGAVFVSITPCRMVDTRTDNSGGLITGTVRNLTLTGAAYTGFTGGNPCTALTGIPSNVAPNAIAVNLTMVGAAGPADLRVAPLGIAPTSSIMNTAGPTVANAATESVGPDGSGGKGISVKSGGASFNLLVDVLGYYSFFSFSQNSTMVQGQNYGASGTGVLGVAIDVAGTGVLGLQGSFSPSITGAAVSGSAGAGYGVAGKSNGNYGVYGVSTSFTGVFGQSTSDAGVIGSSSGSDGVRGLASVNSGAGVYGNNSAGGNGVYGSSATGDGVYGVSGSGGLGVYGSSTGSYGVQGQSDISSGVSGVSNSGRGVDGESTSGPGVYGLSGSDRGVYGESDSNGGVHGESNSGRGVFGHSVSNTAVYGTTDDATGTFAGVSGHGDSGGYGVFGHSSTNHGVHGITASSNGNAVGVFGVDGTGLAGTSVGFSSGVRGESHDGTGVFGISKSFVGVDGLLVDNVGDVKCHGLLGDGIDGFDVTAAGGCGMGGSGPKFFVEPFPGDPSKEIRFVSLEGPESGTYFRGSAQIVNGFATIQVPETFRDVTDSEGLTAVVSAVGQIASLGVITQDLNKIVVQGSADVKFNYMVNGVRKAYKDLNAVHDNVMFVPRDAGARMSTSYAPDIKARLVANGIFNADGTVNVATAQKMGWDKKPSWNRAPNEQSETEK